MTNNLDLNDFSQYITVCELGSFTAAAEQPWITKSILSEHISRLEAHLGVQLLRRTTRKLVVTDVGLTVLNAARQSLDLLNNTIQSVQEQHRQLAGRIKLTSTLDYSLYKLSHQLARFSKLYPNINIELTVTDEKLDLLSDQLDFSIRIGWLIDSSHKAIRLRDFKQIIVAAPSYLAERGVPKTPQDLLQYDWLTLTALSSQQWVFQNEQQQQTVRPKGALSADATVLIHRWALAGAGITVLPDFQVQQDLLDGRLVQLLPDWQLPMGGVFVVYPSNKHLPQRVGVLIKFLQQER